MSKIFSYALDRKIWLSLKQDFSQSTITELFMDKSELSDLPAGLLSFNPVTGDRVWVGT